MSCFTGPHQFCSRCAHKFVFVTQFPDRWGETSLGPSGVGRSRSNLDRAQGRRAGSDTAALPNWRLSGGGRTWVISADHELSLVAEMSLMKKRGANHFLLSVSI